MRLHALLLTAALLLQCVHAKELDFEVCKLGGADPAFVPDSVTVKPAIPAPGTRARFVVTGTASREVAGGKFQAEVFTLFKPIGFLKLYKETKDLCARTECPIKEGPVRFVYDKLLPPIAPTGTYKVKIHVTDLNGEPLMCLELEFQVQRGHSTHVVV